jgi:two-component system nitrogen regulation response regulator GlnG
VKRALVLSNGEVLTPEDFAFLSERAIPEERQAGLAELIELEVRDALDAPDADGGDVYREIIERVERPMLEAVLARTDGNQIKAAALLGINRNTLRKKIAELCIPLPGRE